MKSKLIEYGKEILTEQINHWILFPLVLTVMGLVKELTGLHEPDVAIWCVCSIFPLIFFIMRCKIKRFYIFVLSHMGMVGLVFGINCISPSFQGGICVCAVFVYAAVSLYMLVKEAPYTEPIPLIVGVLISAGAIFLQHYQGTDSWDLYYSFTLIGVIALYFISVYLQHYLDFLVVNQSSAGYLPASEMLRSGFGMTLKFTFLGIIVMIFSTQFEWLSFILNYVKNAIVGFLRMLLSNLPKGTDENIQRGIGIQSNDILIEDMIPEMEEPFWLWEYIWYLLVVVFLILFAKLMIRLLVFLWNYLIRYGTSPNISMKDEEAFDLRERCELEKNSEKKKQKLLGFLSYRERIRKLYKRKLLSASVQMQENDRNRLAYNTAREWEEKLHVEGMAGLYERARYTNHELTGVDVQKMKEILK